MIHKERCIVMDIDGTLCHLRQPGETYAELTPIEPIVETLRKYQEAGFYIILSTARNMQTHEGNLGRIIASTAPVLIDWLKRHDIPYDELHFGKPWQGWSSNAFSPLRRDAGMLVDFLSVQGRSTSVTDAISRLRP